MLSRKFTLGFSTLDKEQELRDLPVAGVFPPWLYGALVRNGPAKFEAGAKRLRHWFDGFAMLHAFSIKNSHVSYANRFLETNAYLSAKGNNDISYSEFATDPCRSLFKRFTQAFYRTPTDNANVNITRIADRFVALTETPLPTIFDPATLATVGVMDYDDGLKAHLTTAHPHYDFERNESVGYLTRFSYRSRYHVYGMPAGGKTRRTIATIPVKEPAYMHSFGVTKNYAVLAEYPLVINPADLLFRGKPFIENFLWQPERGARFLIINRNSGEVISRIETDAFFAFHHINAYESGQSIIVDVAAYDDAGVIDTLYLDVLRGDVLRPLVVTGEFRRYSISLVKHSARFDVVSDQRLELPRIHYKAANTRPYRFIYGAGRDGATPNDFLNQLVKIDAASGNALVWREAGCYPGEPVYVSSPHTREEDEGIVLSVVLNAEKRNSFLLALDARSFREVARAEVPHHIPFGFHGQFFSHT